jgi:pyruvate,water dikinase
VVSEQLRGWEEMYPAYARFGRERGDFDEARFWFRDDLHWADPIAPFEAVVVEFSVVALSQASARLFAMPASLGIEYRILNGYGYVGLRSVADPAERERRARHFAERGAYYYEHWDELYAGWLRRVEDATAELRALEIPRLPELEDRAIVTEGRGWGSSHALLVAYHRLLEGLDLVMQYHFEFLNLGYLAYLAFYELCRSTLPGVPDQTFSQMVAGIDVVATRPDEELKRLARSALELGLAAQVKAAGDEESLRASLAASEAGARWLADFDATKDPWFYFSTGNGLTSHERAWIDDTALPIAMIASYVARLEAGDTISRPRAALVVERDRLTEEHRARLDGEARRSFDERLALARTVFPFVENHNFYIDHRYLVIFWNKMRELGALLVHHRVLERKEDIFCLRHDEIPAVISELRLWWSVGGASAWPPEHWRQAVRRRRALLEAMQRWSPPPVIGQSTEEVADPVALMLWGVTEETPSIPGALAGTPASAGIAEGRARVILTPDELGRVEDGEILVAPYTSASWTPVFGRVAAAVSETGGMMCHAAIMAREYGLPAVVGARTATTVIATGSRIRVDGTAGVVTILE